MEEKITTCPKCGGPLDPDGYCPYHQPIREKPVAATAPKPEPKPEPQVTRVESVPNYATPSYRPTFRKIERETKKDPGITSTEVGALMIFIIVLLYTFVGKTLGMYYIPEMLYMAVYLIRTLANIVLLACMSERQAPALSIGFFFLNLVTGVIVMLGTVLPI